MTTREMALLPEQEWQALYRTGTPEQQAAMKYYRAAAKCEQKVLAMLAGKPLGLVKTVLTHALLECNAQAEQVLKVAPLRAVGGPQATPPDASPEPPPPAASSALPTAPCGTSHTSR